MVDYVSVLDFYEIRLASLISNVDKDVLIELYQPLIGYQSANLYLTLLKQRRNADEDDIYSVELLSKMTQMTQGQLLNARQFLEGVGLLKTYENASQDKRSYIYVLYAPKTPKEFFDDVLFKGLLIQAVGEKEALRLASKYEIDLAIPEEYKEITTSFRDVFSIDYNDPSFYASFSDSIITHKTRNLRLEFNYDKFFQFVEENSQIRRSVLNNKDMVEIERIASLYSLEEKDMAFIFVDCYKPYEEPHISFEEMAQLAKERIKLAKPRGRKTQKKSDLVVNSDSQLLQKAKMMDNLSPIKFLTLLQGNTKPSTADMEVAENLVNQFNLSYGVVNAIIEYTLTRCNNFLNEKFAEKVASTLAREGISDSLSAMNYLNKKPTRKTNYQKVEHKEEPVKEKEPEVVQKEEHISDEELDEILEKISKRKGGKK